MEVLGGQRSFSLASDGLCVALHSAFDGSLDAPISSVAKASPHMAGDDRLATGPDTLDFEQFGRAGVEGHRRPRSVSPA